MLALLEQRLLLVVVLLQQLAVLLEVQAQLLLHLSSLGMSD
jgi:hypothetical protein